MADVAATWVPIVISAAALAVSVTTYVLDGRRSRKAADMQEVRLREAKDAQAQELMMLEESTHRQHLKDVSLTIEKLVTKWRNSILSDQFAVTDDNWSGLLRRATEWRASLAVDQVELLRYTPVGQKTRAYWLVARTVDAAKHFEDVVRPIAVRWEPPPVGVDPYEDKVKVHTAIIELQTDFNEVIERLDKLRGDQLIEGVSLDAV